MNVKRATGTHMRRYARRRISATPYDPDFEKAMEVAGAGMNGTTMRSAELAK